MFCCFSFHSPNYRQFFGVFWCGYLLTFGAHFQAQKRERYSLVLDILFFCCFIQLTCHVTKTSSISGLHAQKIGKPQIEFLTSSLLDRSAKCISCFSKEPTIHSTKWLLPLNTKQIMHEDDFYNVFWRNIVSRQIKFCLGSLILIA